MDFANTLFPAGSSSDLHSWADLVDFLAAVGVVAEDRQELLRRLAETAPEATAQAFEAALSLRRAIRNTLEAMAAGQRVLPEWMQPINQVLRWTEGYDQLQAAGEGWRLGFVEREKRLEWLLAAIARSAAELIAQGPGAPLRKCANPACGLYFCDGSRTRRRRWCSMAVCGNRSKVAAHARRWAKSKRKRKR